MTASLQLADSYLGSPHARSDSHTSQLVPAPRRRRPHGGARALAREYPEQQRMLCVLEGERSGFLDDGAHVPRGRDSDVVGGRDDTVKDRDGFDKRIPFARVLG